MPNNSFPGSGYMPPTSQSGVPGFPPRPQHQPQAPNVPGLSTLPNGNDFPGGMGGQGHGRFSPEFAARHPNFPGFAGQPGPGAGQPDPSAMGGAAQTGMGQPSPISSPQTGMGSAQMGMGQPSAGQMPTNYGTGMAPGAGGSAQPMGAEQNPQHAVLANALMQRPNPRVIR